MTTRIEKPGFSEKPGFWVLGPPISDPHVARYAETAEKQPGWRFDIVVLGPDESAFRELEGLYQARNAIVHGFTTAPIKRGAVAFLLKNATKLLESQAVQKTV